MQCGDAVYRAHVGAHVAAYSKPNVVSLADDIHIFHFEDGEKWRQAPILLVNRNGHSFRAVKSSGGQYQFVKHWEGKPDFLHWEEWAETPLKRACPEALIRLAGTGPQGKTPHEMLTLLPKTTTNRRKAVWRDKILDVRFDMDLNRFTISEGFAQSATFSGKLWESREAAAWCLAHLSAPMVSIAATPVVKAEDDKLMMELEGSEAWGMF